MRHEKKNSPKPDKEGKEKELVKVIEEHKVDFAADNSTDLKKQ